MTKTSICCSPQFTNHLCQIEVRQLRDLKQTFCNSQYKLLSPPSFEPPRSSGFWLIFIMLSRMFSVFSVSKAPQYHAVDAEALLKAQDASDTDSVGHISNFALERSPRRGIVAKIILVFLAISSIFLNILLVFKDPSISKCIERTSIWCTCLPVYRRNLH